MSAEFVSVSPLFAVLHERLEDPARDALGQFVQRCDEADHAWSVAELMFLYAMGIATVTAAVIDRRGGSTTDVLGYINDEMQASFLMFLDAEAEEDEAPRPTAESVVAGYLDAEVRFYYEVVAIALEALHVEAAAIARGDAWAALTRAVDAAYLSWTRLVARHADFGEPPADKLQLLTSCTVVMALRVLSRLAPADVGLQPHMEATRLAS